MDKLQLAVASLDKACAIMKIIVDAGKAVILLYKKED